MDLEYTELLRERSPFIKLLGLDVLKLDNGTCQLSLKIKDNFLNVHKMEEMSKSLVNAGFPERTIHKNNHSNISYYFRFTGMQVPMLYHYLYDNVPETEYLKRKNDLFLLSLEMNAKAK